MNCQSTFDTRYKMKTHTQKEHNVDEEPKSPARKLAKTMNKDDNEKPEDQTMDSVKPSNKNKRI